MGVSDLERVLAGYRLIVLDTMVFCIIWPDTPAMYP